MFHQLGWIDGQWGKTEELKIPINDSGLNLGDGIFETILIFNGQPQLLKEHLTRWKNSADLLGMASPPNHEELESMINEAIERSSLQRSNGALRINWTRGARQKRRIDVSANNISPSNHRFWLEICSNEPCFHAVSAIISKYEQRNAKSRLSQCKLLNYVQSIQAMREANRAGCDEALILSTNGYICCGSTANLIIKRKNQWITPNLKSGCLPGIMRQQGINSGLIKELEIERQPQGDDQWLLINSLSCKPIRRLNNIDLPIYGEAEKLWLKLLNLESH